METIVAQSTAVASIGAVGIIRLSGDEAIDIASKIFSSTELTDWENIEPRKMYLGNIITENFGDKAFCVYYKAPKSYTGEDIVEFQSHGGKAVLSGILRLCVKYGARPALPGEFTKRAFLNGKMTLEQAEGIQDIVNAGSEAEANQAYRLMSGELSKTIFSSAKKLEKAVANIEVALDYPEELLDDTRQPTLDIINEVLSLLQILLDNSANRRVLKDGLCVAIAGLPNVGKSSLMNALLKDDRAIVTDIAGTTRDTLSEAIEIDGIKINLTDTAGIHESNDTVEKIGIDRAKNAVEGADLVIVVLDGTTQETEDEKELIRSIKHKKHIIVKNKCDTTNSFARNCDIEISAKNNINLDKLLSKILSITGVEKLNTASVLTRERHIFAVRQAVEALTNAKNTFDFATPDCVIVDIKTAYSALCSITGADVNESIVDRIFSEFCVGK